MKKMGPGMGVMSFSKSKAKLFAESETKVTFADVAGIDEAIDRVVGGLEKKNRVMNPQEKEIVAFHESGHAIVAESVEHADPCAQNLDHPQRDCCLGLYTAASYGRSLPDDPLRVTGSTGRSFRRQGSGGTGFRGDLHRCPERLAAGNRHCARSMVAEYGMSDLLGPVTYERPRQAMFLPENYSPAKTYSETRATRIDEEISGVMEKAEERVRNILSERRKVLDDLTRLLSQKEVVQGEELRKMLSESSAEGK